MIKYDNLAQHSFDSIVMYKSTYNNIVQSIQKMNPEVKKKLRIQQYFYTLSYYDVLVFVLVMKEKQSSCKYIP